MDRTQPCVTVRGEGSSLIPGFRLLDHLRHGGGGAAHPLLILIRSGVGSGNLFVQIFRFKSESM